MYELIKFLLNKHSLSEYHIIAFLIILQNMTASVRTKYLELKAPQWKWEY